MLHRSCSANQVYMRNEGRTHLEVPTQQLKLGRSKSLNAPRSASFTSMSVRPKRTFSLPNRERTSLPIVHIHGLDNDRFDDDIASDRETERSLYLSAEQHTSNGGDAMEPLYGFLISVVFLIWSWMLDAFD